MTVVNNLFHRPMVTRIEPLWLMLDEHFPGERNEARASAIDDLYVDILDAFRRDLAVDGDYDEWGY